MTGLDKWAIRQAMWRGLRWDQAGRGYLLDADRMAQRLAELVRDDVLARLFARLDIDGYLEASDRIGPLIEQRCAAIMERVIASVEEQGLAVPGIEGSIDRVLESLLHSVNGGEGDEVHDRGVAPAVG